MSMTDSASTSPVPPSVSPPPGAGAGGGSGGATSSNTGPSPLQIGKSFIKQYYKVLSSSPEHIHKFYKSTSSISHGFEPSVPAETVALSDLDDISTEVRTKLFSWAEPSAEDGSVVTLDFERGAIDAQVSVGGGVLLVVTGLMTLPGSSGKARPFVHTFFLNSGMAAAGKRRQFYVHNDVLRFLSEDDVSTDDAAEDNVVLVDGEDVAAASAAEEVETKQSVEESEAAVAPLSGLAPMPSDGAVVGDDIPALPSQPSVADAAVIVPPVAMEPATSVIPIEREEAVPEMKDGEEEPPVVIEEAPSAVEEVIAPVVPEAQDRPETTTAAADAEIADAAAPPSGGKDARSSKQQRSGGGDRRQKRKSGGAGGKRGGNSGSRSTSPTENAQQDGGKPPIAPSDKTADKEEKSELPPKQPQAVPIPATAPPPTPPKPKTPGSWASLVAGGPQPASPMSQPPAAAAQVTPEEDDNGKAGQQSEINDKVADENKADESASGAATGAAGGSSSAGSSSGERGAAPPRRDQRVPPRSSHHRHRPQSAEQAGAGGSGGAGPSDSNNNRGGGGRVPNSTLFIKNIPDSTKESDIRGLFEPQAARTGHRILSITLNPNRGFCFVDFDGPEAVSTVLKENVSSQVKDDDGRIISSAFMVNGRTLEVEKKATDGRRGGGGGSGGGRTYHRSASPGNGMYKGGRGGHPRRTSPRGGGGGGRRSNAGTGR